MSTALKHDFIQTDDKVVVYVMIKNANELNCKVTIEQDRLLIETDGGQRLELNLCESINAEKSSYKFDSLKVEITLIKLFGRRWAELTKEKAQAKPEVVSTYKQDWDALAKSIIEREMMGEPGENVDPFQKIYENATPEVQRAMNKSYLESNGTTLSTHLPSVADKKQEPLD